MSEVDDNIKSVSELQKAQNAANAMGKPLTNYSQWEKILEDFDTIGIEGTGSFDGDLKLHSEVMNKIQDFIEKTQNEEQAKQIDPKNNESSKVDNKTVTDKEQVIKSNVANSTSSVIMADYMKYYHML